MRRALIASTLVASAALAFATFGGFAAADEKPAAATLESATKAFEEGRFDDCAKACADLPKTGDEGARALYLRGESLLLLHKAEEAEKDFRAVLKLHAKSVPARIGLGRALAAKGSLEDAEKELREVVKTEKKNAVAHRALGEVLVARQQYSDARTILNKAWKLDEGNPLTAIPLVDAELGYKNAKGALGIAKDVVKAHPDHPVGHFLAGRALEYDGEWEAAVEAYEKAVACDDTYLDAHKNLAIVLHTQNPMYRDRPMLDKAMTHYARYFELGGNAPELRDIYDKMVAFVKWWDEQQGK